VALPTIPVAPTTKAVFVISDLLDAAYLEMGMESSEA
jgi:hypothetical protein